MSRLETRKCDGHGRASFVDHRTRHSRNGERIRKFANGIADERTNATFDFNHARRFSESFRLENGNDPETRFFPKNEHAGVVYEKFSFIFSKRRRIDISSRLLADRECERISRRPNVIRH